MARGSAKRVEVAADRPKPARRVKPVIFPIRLSKETSELLAVGHFNPGGFPYPDLIVLVHDRFTNTRGYGETKLWAFQLISQQDRVEIVPIEIPATGL